MCAVGGRKSEGVRPLGRMGLRVEVSGSRWARRKGAGESLAKVWAGKVRLFWVVSEVVAVGATGLTAIELVRLRWIIIAGLLVVCSRPWLPLSITLSHIKVPTVKYLHDLPGRDSY